MENQKEQKHPTAHQENKNGETWSGCGGKDLDHQVSGESKDNSEKAFGKQLEGEGEERDDKTAPSLKSELTGQGDDSSSVANKGAQQACCDQHSNRQDVQTKPTDRQINGL